MKRIAGVLLILAIGIGVYADDLAGPKKKVAVMKFEDKVRDHWYGYDVGEGIADMLVTTLVKSDKVTVIEREMLDKVMEEQRLGQTGAVTQGSAAKLGKLLGVGAIITGGVTEFGMKDSGGKVGGLGGLTGGLLSGFGLQTYTARVSVDMRMIDTATGEIITAETATAEESDSKVDFDSWNLPDFSMGSNGFSNTLIGKATRKAIDELVKKISVKTDKLAWKSFILKASGTDIWISAGSEAGIKQGMKFKVMSKGEEVESGDGEVFVIPGEEVAQVEVTTVTPKISKVKVISGGNVVKDLEVVSQ